MPCVRAVFRCPHSLKASRYLSSAATSRYLSVTNTLQTNSTATSRLQKLLLVWVWVWHVTTDGQSASLSWYKAPNWGLRPDFYFRSEYGIRLTVTFLIPWVALSDERMGLSFVCEAGPCQRSLSRVLVPWDLRPYFTVSDVRLPFLSPPTTRRVTVEVFDPASTRVYCCYHSNWGWYRLGADRTENSVFPYCCERCLHSRC
jgi:hypothetical protein